MVQQNRPMPIPDTRSNPTLTAIIRIVQLQKKEQLVRPVRLPEESVLPAVPQMPTPVPTNVSGFEQIRIKVQHPTVPTGESGPDRVYAP